jgi:2-methylisocitrate lyase-like PEP mutase family enzyme
VSTFADLHRPGQPLLLPNAWDFASAASLVAAGFPAIGTTSLGVAAAHGIPDAAGYGRAETLALARLVTRLPSFVTVDCEAGFSDDPGEAAELVAELADLGVAGVNLEDGLRDIRHHERLIETVKARVPGVFVNARTDTYWLGADDPLGSTIARAERYVAAGADGIFVPGITADADIEAATGAVPVPVNVLWLPGRFTVGRLAALGVARVSTGSLLYREALHAAVQSARAIRGDEAEPHMPTYQQVQELVRAFGNCRGNGGIRCPV